MLQELQRKRNVTISTKFYFAPIPVLFRNAKRLDFDEPSRLPYTPNCANVVIVKSKKQKAK